MSFDFSGFLQDAKTKWSSHSSSTPLLDSELRNIISRSYYSAFHKCLEHAKSRTFVYKKNPIGKTDSEHVQLRNWFRSNHSNGTVISTKLAELHKLRIAADYHSDFDRDLRGQKFKGNVVLDELTAAPIAIKIAEDIIAKV